MQPNPLWRSSIDEVARNIRLVALDFDGVFTANTVYVDQRGYESVRCSRADGIGLQHLALAGIASVVLSTEPNPVVEARCRKLRVNCHQGLVDKLDTLREYAAGLDISLDRVAFLGNDVNDLGCLLSVALPCIVADADAVLLRYPFYRTRSHGGEGAVREFCDLIAHSLSLEAD